MEGASPVSRMPKKSRKDCQINSILISKNISTNISINRINVLNNNNKRKMLNRISIFFFPMISEYHLLFSKGHFFYKINYYKFCIVIFNKSFKSKLICDTHTHTHTHTVHLQSYCPISLGIMKCAT